MPDGTQDSYNVAADDLRGFIERYERIEASRKELAEEQKEILQEAKSRGYDVKALKAVIRERAQNPDDVAELEATIAMYRDALSMAGGRRGG